VNGYRVNFTGVNVLKQSTRVSRIVPKSRGDRLLGDLVDLPTKPENVAVFWIVDHRNCVSIKENEPSIRLIDPDSVLTLEQPAHGTLFQWSDSLTSQPELKRP
jgi:hypothetical protein